jgi:pimeloyl-ACP methyl ester carboxylesterase
MAPRTAESQTAGPHAAGAWSTRVATLGIGLEVALSGLARREASVGDHRVVYLDSRSPAPAGDGIPMVMVHGFGGDKLNWVRYAKHLTRRRRTVIPDLPGFGESDRLPGTTYSIDNQVTWLAAFLDGLGIRRFHLVGNSMGGHIGTRFAARFPDRVETLVLHAPAGTDGAGPPWDITKIERGRHPLKVFSPEDFDSMLRCVFVKPPLLIGPVRRFFAARAIANQPFNEKIFHDITPREGGNDVVDALLPSIAAPTLVLWGDTDRLLDCSHARTYERLMPNARAIVLRDCGHMPMAERPRDTARMTIEFLDSTRGQAALSPARRPEAVPSHG